MKKLAFENIMIEITRACDMQPACQHCFRGDTQDVELSYEDIDALLAQTEMIGSVWLTGGEPLLSIDKIKYILTKAWELRIPVFKFYITTNGLRDPEETIPLIKEWSAYIRECNIKWRELDRPGSDFTGIEISFDPYHSHADIASLHFEQYTKELTGVAYITKSTRGQVPRRIGRARNLPKEKTFGDMRCDELCNRQIPLLDKNHKPICMNYRTYTLWNPERTFVCCDLYVTAKGAIIPAMTGGILDYAGIDQPKNVISYCGESIYDGIIKYNDGRLDCFDWHEQLAKHGNEFLDIEWSERQERLHPVDILLARQGIGGFSKMPHQNSITDDEVLTYSKGGLFELHRFFSKMRADIAQRDFTKPYVAPDKRLAATRAKVDSDMTAIEKVWAEQEREATND